MKGLSPIKDKNSYAIRITIFVPEHFKMHTYNHDESQKKVYFPANVIC